MVFVSFVVESLLEFLNICLAVEYTLVKLISLHNALTKYIIWGKRYRLATGALLCAGAMLIFWTQRRLTRRESRFLRPTVSGTLKPSLEAALSPT